MVYEYSDPVLDFDDANNFLSMLLSTVPTLEKPQKWDDRLYVLDDSLDEFDGAELVPSIVSDMHSSVASDLPSTGSDVMDMNMNMNMNMHNMNNMDMNSVNVNDMSMFNLMGTNMDMGSSVAMTPAANTSAGFEHVSPEMTMAPELMALHNQFATDNARMLSLSLGSYLDLIVLHFGASANGTPNTAASLPHNLPDVRLKQEVVLPFPEVPQIAASELEPESTDAVLPKQRTVTKNKVAKPVRKAKVLHNMIEKKYRTNINSKILELRDAVPTLRIATGKTNVLVAELEGLLPASKLNKASVLTKATEYIKHLERKNDVMRQQIERLQGLVHGAAANPPAAEVPRIQRAPNTDLFQMFDDFPYASQLMSVGPSRDNNMGSMMAGGLAMMGSQLMTGEHFRGMAAVPFFPAALAHPSALTLQMLAVARTAVFVAGAVLFFAPVVAQLRAPAKGTSSSGGWLVWILVWMGLRLPQPLAPEVRDRVKLHLSGQCACTTRELVADFAALGAAEVQFESSLLYMLVGAVLVQRWPMVEPAVRMSMRWRGGMLMNLDYSGDDEYLTRLSALFKKLDGVAMFDSARLVARIDNVVSGRPVNAGINNGENYLNYVEMYIHNKRDVYAVVFNWRVLEIVHELNLSYLDVMTEDADKQQETVAEIKKSVQKLDSLLLDDKGLVVQYFTLFKCILFPETTPELMAVMKNNIADRISTVDAIVDGCDLTDDEQICDSDSDGSSSVSTATAAVNPLDTIASQKSLVYLMNLMNEEKFIVLTSALVEYYTEHHDAAKAAALVRYLRFKSGKVPLSMLLFTCLVKLLCAVIGDDNDGAEVPNSAVLESLVKMTRGWLSDETRKNYMTHRLRSELLDLVMTKGMALSDM